MFVVNVLGLVVLLVVVLLLFVLGAGWLRRRYPSLQRSETRRWNPLAALGTLVLATVMYAGLCYSFPTFPRGWTGVLLVLGAIFVNGLLTAFDD